MTLLRQQMIDAMQQRGFSPRTHKSYLAAVAALARFFHKSPDQLQQAQIQAYFVYLVKERHLSAASCKLYLNGIRFLYLQVLKWDQFDVPIQTPKRPQKIPELLTRQEVKQIIEACDVYKHRLMLLTCYGCGLRVSELVALKVRQLDGERRLLRVEQGKGAKDRAVVLSVVLLNQLRRYWQKEQPKQWLFPNSHTPHHHLSITTAQKVFKRAKDKTGIEKIGGIHSLRHAYATHQLESGLPVYALQQQLGHSDIQSTMHYVHWVALSHGERSPVTDLVEQLGVDHE
ncbi:MAG: site-specific integrase [Candidatus Thiodiazotropha sp. (ex Troendleina suluensis)]|nr:site-specific integrase [Candidatus Thiodiazotropha sp. (ex Troendleina suluensis)]